MYYQLLKKLTTSSFDQVLTDASPFVAVLQPSEWLEKKEAFNIPIDMEFRIDSASSTKAEVNSDALTGTFKIPNRKDLLGPAIDFSFVLTDRGIIFIDQHDHASDLMASIEKSKKWKTPSLERFLYDFLETIIKDDLSLL
ncbi:CorA-like domain protein [Streptococcus ictaluri 707-05]|uniref:CorA-like domain protein n=1 Tax=Streptococcus ictaluri 707-05 TaxID=764299 RepID=G5K661_9STRE|nr:CorA-like domain protein [Streptococcus ictaluri 707-05]